MVQLCRAEDGQVVELNYTIWDLEREANLEQLLEEKAGIYQGDGLAYLSDGRRLTKDNVRDMAGVEDQTIYLFNKRYLDLDVNQALAELREEPSLQPPVEDEIASTPPFRISQLATSYEQAARQHHEQIRRTLTSLHYQHSALRIASSVLDLHVLAIADVYDGVSAAAHREIDRQAALLDGLDADLEVVARVHVHKEFMSPATRKAMDVGERGRTLGDYVSKVKMRQVADSCVRTHDDIKDRLTQSQEIMSRLNDGAREVREFVNQQSPLDEAEASAKKAQESFDQIAEYNSTKQIPSSQFERVVHDLRRCDGVLRDQLVTMSAFKGTYTEGCILVLRQISALNHDLIELRQLLTSLQAGLKAKTSFSHIQRLHNMLYAYGATVIEIVRRKEFARFFYQRAQSILEVMAKLSASERKRRQLYRGDVHGQLPFETRGMDDPVPTIDFSPTGSLDLPYSLERPDIDDLLHVLDDLERFAEDSQDPAALSSVREARSSLDKLIGKMDSLESGFDRIAERSLLSASRLSNHRRRTTEEDIDLEIQVQELREMQAQRELSFQNERQALEGELAELRLSLKSESSARDQLERDLHSAKAQLESDSTSRRILEERNAELSSGADQHRGALSRALAEATEQTKAAEFARQELAQVRAEFKHVKAIEKQNSDRLNNLLEEQASSLKRLEEARARGEDLEVQIREARAESEEVKRSLAEAAREKERLLRAQATEHDRVMRDHIVEADGDRAVLEHQFSELKATLGDTERQLKDARAQAEMAQADAVGLREELQRVEHTLREAQHIEHVLREDLRVDRVSQSEYEQRLENSNRLVAQLLDVALAFRESHLKALAAAQAMVTHPAANRSSTLTDSAASPGRHSILTHLHVEPSPIDPSDPVAALEALRAFDHDHFLDAVNKAGSTIRKWQKQCKEYRERAKGKISFRNFAKGDLALFLPTRNSVSKPWAAFNVSFPHYFLQATGHLAEQLKTREWIVARITSITERVVDHKDPSTNPYGLGDGVKYYMLEVEDWTQPAYPSKRRDSAKKVSTEVKESTSPPMPSPPIPETSPLPVPGIPPENEVEDSFNATRPPNSRLFPVRPRVNSSPTAGLSSLSRLLAQAQPPELSLEQKESLPVEQKPPAEAKLPSPAPSPQPPPSPPQTGSVPRSSIGQRPSSLRPGSRASRASSKFSTGRMPFGVTSSGAKAVATTAISEQAASPASDISGTLLAAHSGSVTPSPEGSPTDGVVGLVSHRRRTTSYHVPRPSSSFAPTTVSVASPLSGTHVGITAGSTAGATARSTLATLASSWGFGRKQRSSLAEEQVTSPDTPGPNPISPSHVWENSTQLSSSPPSMPGNLHR
ncbi:putative peripheral membrane protein [Daedalea quercina L-15889]|uniref:Autophagy-related protein 11 n=1 Tax=Daedalea quercina L-15889 TaxID=1314783 RepID=A0A165M7K2_9APHY|nr:putative peripheral membrane protein [Daedalea quercina L-15889]